MNKKVLVLIIGIVVIIAAVFAIIILNVNRNEVNNENPVDNNENGTVNDNNNNSDNNNDGSNEGDDNVNGENRALVLYFSMSGNTETVANFIHENVGGDIVKLETVKTYPNSYNDLLDVAQQEQRSNDRPELKTTININDYDVIFIGYPNWWGDMPMAIYSFLDNYDLSGKTIAPFITHGGSGLSGTPNKIRSLEPSATVTEGLAVSGSSASSSQSTVNSWIERIGF